jgi:hypothetical protein
VQHNSLCIQLLQQNSYPTKEWHLENMKKTVVKYVTGLLDNATLDQKRHHKKYSSNLAWVHRSIASDIKHGVKEAEVLDFLEKIRNNNEFAYIRNKEGSLDRLDLVKIHLCTPMPY